MITKKEFKELSIDEQVKLVNTELKEAKGTKSFGQFNLDFSYGFARSILTNDGYDTLDEISMDGTKVKLFRKMNEEELQQKENKELEKQKEKEIVVQEPTIIDTNTLQMIIATDMYNKNLEIDENKKTISKTLPIFEDTYKEFQNLLKSNEFKMYEKKYVVELMFRTFLNKYSKED